MTQRPAPPIPPAAAFGLDDPADRTPKRHARRLRMLEALPKGGVGAEVGVFSGTFTPYILAVTQPRRLLLIDPWERCIDDPTTAEAQPLHHDTALMRSLRARVTARLADQPAIEIIHDFSIPALSRLDDDALDWVYLDGNHMHAAVAADLRLAARKVRLGGIIAGDDYLWAHGDDRPVRRAVEAFLAAADAPPPRLIGQQYLIEVTPALKAAHAEG